MNHTWWSGIQELKGEQKKIISLPLHTNYLVLGPPGSGKTNLLLLRANYFARAGHPNILLLVFTRLLREFIVTGGVQYAFDTSKVKTHTKWQRDLLFEYGVKLKIDPDGEADFEKHRAELNSEISALIKRKKLHGLYDAVLLDEAQDYLPEEVEYLAKLGKELSTPWSETASAKRDTGDYVSTTTLLDGLGRAYETELGSDPAGTDLTVTSFNSSGQVAAVTNPYRTTSDPTYGSTSYAYDALGRVTAVTHPDSSVANITYYKRATQVQDEGNGTSPVVKDYQIDGLGRTVSACEVTNTNLTDGGDKTFTSCSQDITANGFVTTYTYDLLNNLTNVAQGSSQSRSYVYDQMARLTSDSNPESGATTYVYDTGAPGDLYTRTRPQPNQSNPATTVTTTYTFDALHRLTREQYSDGVTPTVAFAYDQTSFYGITGITNSLGRLTAGWVAAGSTYQSRDVYSYDKMGRPLQNWQCLAAQCNSNTYYAMPYTYDLLGNVSSSSVSGATISYSYDNASNVTGITSSLVDSAHPSSLLSGTAYNPLRELTQSMSGTNTMSSGFSQAWTYDNRGRTSYYRSSVNGHGTLEIQSGISYSGNGNVLGFADGILGYTWSFGYDDFNRLISTTQTSGVAYTYDYDRYGNRWNQVVTAGTGWPVSLGFNTSNKITPAACSGSGSYCYDAAGNLTSDSFHAYTYDPEGHVLTVDGTAAVYGYDALGRRVVSVTGANTWYFGYDLASRIAWELNGTSWYRGEVYGPKGRQTTYKAGYTFFPTQDVVGTVRNNTTQDAGYQESCLSLPFGDGQSCYGTASGLPSLAFFTGQDRDTESNLDHFWFRQYSSTQGRWTSPDPAGLGAVGMSNPQTWNRYGYVANNPTSDVDPVGLFHCPVLEWPIPKYGLGPCSIVDDPYFGGDGSWGFGGGWGDEDGGWGGNGGGDGFGYSGPTGICGSDFLPCGLPPVVAGPGLPCDFGVCGPPIGNGYALPGPVLAGAGGTLEGVCIFVEPCGLAEIIGLGAGTVAVVYGPQIVQGVKDIGKEIRCEYQHESDLNRCRSLPNPAARARCYDSADNRLGACLQGNPLPPLITW